MKERATNLERAFIATWASPQVPPMGTYAQWAQWATPPHQWVNVTRHWGPPPQQWPQGPYWTGPPPGNFAQCIATIESRSYSLNQTRGNRFQPLGVMEWGLA